MFFAKYSALQDMTPNPSRQASFAQFPNPHATMKRHAGPILEKWPGQTLLAKYTPAYQTAVSVDCPFTPFFGTVPSRQTGLLKFLFPILSFVDITRVRWKISLSTW